MVGAPATTEKNRPGTGAAKSSLLVESALRGGTAKPRLTLEKAPLPDPRGAASLPGAREVMGEAIASGLPLGGVRRDPVTGEMLGGVSSMLRIRADAEWVIVRRRGRFSMEAQAAKSPMHQTAAVEKAIEDFVRELKWKYGYEYVSSGPGFAFSGFVISPPLNHIAFSPDVTPDPGSVEAPPPPGSGASDDQIRNYREVLDRYESVEKARVARKFEPNQGEVAKVDFVLVGHFKHKVQPGFRIHQPHQHEARQQMRQSAPVGSAQSRLRSR